MQKKKTDYFVTCPGYGRQIPRNDKKVEQSLRGVPSLTRKDVAISFVSSVIASPTKGGTWQSLSLRTILDYFSIS